MFFIRKLSDYIKADKLTYLVPDWVNDFDLEGIRKSVNFYFNDSAPLPKSIAAIFAWQSSKKFVQDRVQENDFVLVVDSFDGGISITPVQAIYQKELDEILPETQGISWERHPTVIVPNRGIHAAMARNLDRNGCQTSEKLLHLFGFDGLVSDSGKVSFVKDGHWYHLPSSIRVALTQDLDLNILSNSAISDCLHSTNRDYRGVNVFILPLEDTIKKPGVGMDYKWLESAWSPIEGSQILNRWQEDVSDIALWRDHLPELSIEVQSDKGYKVNFYLVKDATVTPQRGRTVDILVEEFFTLPAGQIHYSFPLRQGDGNNELHFVAFLKSPAFPLKKDTVCKLMMTYTYGADDPYELRFIPLDSAEAGFKSIRVEWRSASEGEAVDLESLPVPEFPARKSWSDFHKFPDKEGKPKDLLSNIENELCWIDSILKYGRISAEITSDWRTNANGYRFCLADGTYLSEFSFDLFNGQDLPERGETVQFYKIKSGGKFQAKYVTFKNSNPKKLFSPKFYFSLFTIWNDGHSLSESDVPDHFRNAIFEGTQKILSIIESENMPDTLKEELFFFLCCLHKDAPGIVGSRLLDAVKDKKLLRRYYKNIAFAIGNAELPYQQELLDNVINPIDNEGLTISVTMEVLSIALWRSKTLLKKIKLDDLSEISQNLYDCLNFDLEKVASEVKGYQVATLSKHLELLFALLRSRESEDKEYKLIFSPVNELTKKYVKLLDEISKTINEKRVTLKFRINLEIEKPEIFKDTPDLIYALQSYVTGDSGANNIVISSINDD
ncbi:hypothetical protein GCM10010919_27970 [Alishewanella longhuensis]|uniref:Uncharacterized protein n=2 Tax=Alishewanella longhuensis TaxID=1091037 RepID=A0ABQ3L0F1_9ALTE|nr:hypothetical protein GCM10010919_27970 [Alishewanella longhuensis]